MASQIPKKIHLPRGAKSKLMREFGVCDKTLWNAVNFKNDTTLSKSIRKKACVDYAGYPIGISLAKVINAV